MNTALPEVHCVKTKKGDIQTFNKCIYAATFLIIRGISIKSIPPFLLYQIAIVLLQRTLESSLWKIRCIAWYLTLTAALLQAERKNCFVFLF